MKNASLADVFRANQKGDLIELFPEQFEDFQHLKALREACRRPVIFKIKQMQDLEWAQKLQPEIIDYPHDAPSSLIENLPEGSLRLCSFHDFERTPEDLEGILQRMRQIPADIYKIATFAQTTLDSLRMLLFAKKSGVIGLCMGEEGAITRILAPVVGVPWMYCSLKNGKESAPGQLCIDELLATYHYRTLSSKTALYGLIGDPVTKSHSHRTHNFALDRLRVDAVYVKMKVEQSQVGEFLTHARLLGFSGLSVTMPLKESIIPYIDHPHSETGAFNTLKFDSLGTSGWNTDGLGCAATLEKRVSLSGKKIFLIGAGGAAKGFAMEASKRGAQVTIFNRTYERAQDLAKKIHGRAYCLTDFPQISRDEGYDILVNATCVGMGEDLRMPIAKNDLLENRLVMDMISNPEETPLLRFAKEKSCMVISGMEMFIQQAVEQFHKWFDL